ncbi:MAG TPA: helix-turn-helix domain-containing protein [Ignavibacteria bacterium]|nr:helix-turn-helix domain-containing protein [Ignavibacteria bacterium]HMR40734.1 helix-turn-helix domain-containing protein [Ignavibacteria bacterium]
MKQTISSKKAAGYFNVNESTIKRWADSGALKCYRTEGGHRKFLLEDLKLYAKENNYVTSDFIFTGINGEYKNDVIGRNYKSLIKKLKRNILSGDTEKTYGLLNTLYMNDFSLEEIFDYIVKETMIIIGKEWAEKTLNIENEHIATNTLIASLHQFERVISKRQNLNKSALCAGLENDYHEAGLLCVKITLEEEGWNVIYPGINLPFKSISDLVTKSKTDLICISSTYIKDQEDYIKKLNDLKKICKKTGSVLIVGGENKLKSDISELTCKSITELKSIIKKFK